MTRSIDGLPWRGATVAWLLVATACQHVPSPGSGGGIGQARSVREGGGGLPRLAQDLLRLELEAQRLRPLARALAGRSFGEDSVDTLESHLVVTASLLLENEGQPGADARTAAEIGLSAGGLYYDLLRADLEATARGIGGVSRSNCNRGVEHVAIVRLNMAKDWRWVISHRPEAEAALQTAEDFRDNVLAALPLANVLKAGVAAAQISSMAVSTISLLKLVKARGLPGLTPLVQWLEAGGFEGATLELAGVGSGLGIRAVAGAQTLVLGDATVIALVKAGQIAASTVALPYMARGHLHHICTDKNWESDTRGGPWSPIFKKFLDGAKLGFNDPENLVEVVGHQGPHPRAYHEEVLRELQVQTKGTAPGSEQFRAGVLRALRALAEEIKTPGTLLNRLITGSSP